MTETLSNDEYLWIGRTSNHMGERKIPPNKYFSKTQWACICRAVWNETKIIKAKEYKDIIGNYDSILQECGVQNINDLDTLKNYKTVSSCNPSCGNCSELVLKLVYKEKLFYIFRCGAFGTLFYFWE